jgi:hypothetical protein
MGEGMMNPSAETIKAEARRLAQAQIAKGFQPQALHSYTDADGTALFWRIRLKHPQTGEKWIRPIKASGGGFAFGEPAFPAGKPLYRLHELANETSEPVFIVEGEYCADALARIGIQATTSGAADSAAHANWQVLTGRSVVIWPDHDEAGQRYATAVAAALHQIGCVVRIVDVAGLNLPHKGDVVNWLAMQPNATLADVLALSSFDAVPVAANAAPGNASTTPDAALADSAWPEPNAIQAPLRPVPAFDADTLLPDVLRDWVMDESDRMQCPPDFIAVAAIVALGSLVGARCAIKPKAFDTWLIVPNLWGGIVGVPSVKKSPAINAALAPLARLGVRAGEIFQAESQAYQAEKTVFDALHDAIHAEIKVAAKGKAAKTEKLDALAQDFQKHQSEAPLPPIQRRYVVNDATVEKLGELLRDNPAGLLAMRDELVGMIANWDREGREGERGFYLEAWNGNSSHITDRIGRGSIPIPNLCVSVFGGIQPDKLAAYLRQAAFTLSNDGMVQRFQMLVYPDPDQWKYRDRAPAMDARERAIAVFDELAEFDPVSWGATPADESRKFPHFGFDAAAQALFIEWMTDLNTIRQPAEEHPILQQHFAKYEKLFPALALLLHLVECAATGQRGPVSAAAALRAGAWCQYLDGHARRCYGLLIDTDVMAAQVLAEHIRMGKLEDGFTAREVVRKNWRHLNTAEAVAVALEWLEDEGWLRAYSSGGTGPGGGRHTLRYLINPKAVKMGKAGGKHD